MNKRKEPQASSRGENLLRLHKLHVGLYHRVAKRLHMHASYVSRVAAGERDSEPVMRELVQELSTIQKKATKIAA